MKKPVRTVEKREIVFQKRANLSEVIVTRHTGITERPDTETRLGDTENEENEYGNCEKSVIFIEKRKYFLFNNVIFYIFHNKKTLLSEIAFKTLKLNDISKYNPTAYFSFHILTQTSDKNNRKTEKFGKQ